MTKESITELKLAIIAFRAKFITLFERLSPMEENDNDIMKAGAIIDRNITSIEKQLKKL